MKATKSRLSWLKKKISDVIPEDQDVFGFPGISRKILLDSLEESYSLLDLIDPFNGTFEAVFLEREVSDLYEKATKIGKEDFSKNPNSFNDFLKIIQKIRLKIKDTYILLAKEPIRTEIELKKLKDEAIILSEVIENAKPISEEVISIRNSTENIFKDLSDLQNKSSENQKNLQAFLDVITSEKNKATKALRTIESTESKIKETESALDTNNSKQAELIKKVESLEFSSNDLNQKLQEQFDQLKSQLSENEKFQKQIQNTIDDVNRLGMAGSFKKRKDELTKPYWFWAIATIVTIIILISISSYVIIKAIKINSLSYDFLLLRLPIFASFVWLGWFCARQFGFTSRIREDYSFKYAVSMAFEGYKKEAKEVNEDLLAELLSTTIANISKTPLSNYDSKTNHGTPTDEIVKKMSSKFLQNKKEKKQEAKIMIENEEDE